MRPLQSLSGSASFCRVRIGAFEAYGLMWVLPGNRGRFLRTRARAGASPASRRCGGRRAAAVGQRGRTRRRRGWSRRTPPPDSRQPGAMRRGHTGRRRSRATSHRSSSRSIGAWPARPARHAPSSRQGSRLRRPMRGVLSSRTDHARSNRTGLADGRRRPRLAACPCGGGKRMRRRRARRAGPRAALPFHTVVGWRCLSFLGDLHSSLAGIAVIFCQNDSVAPGLGAQGLPRE